MPATDNTLFQNRASGNRRFDGSDFNFEPPCDNNSWTENMFVKINKNVSVVEAKCRAPAPARSRSRGRTVGQRGRSRRRWRSDGPQPRPAPFLARHFGGFEHEPVPAVTLGPSSLAYGRLRPLCW